MEALAGVDDKTTSFHGDFVTLIESFEDRFQVVAQFDPEMIDRKRALGTRAPDGVAASPNQRWTWTSGTVAKGYLPEEACGDLLAVLS